MEFAQTVRASRNCAIFPALWVQAILSVPFGRLLLQARAYTASVKPRTRVSLSIGRENR